MNHSAHNCASEKSTFPAGKVIQFTGYLRKLTRVFEDCFKNKTKQLLGQIKVAEVIIFSVK